MSGKNSSRRAIVLAHPEAGSGSSLVPMLIGGLVMIVLGMIAVAIFA